MSPVLIIVFLVGCLGTFAFAAVTFGGGVKGVRDEVYEKNAEEDLDGFSAIFVSGMMAITGLFTLICMSAIIVFCAWRIFAVAF
jgi:hypothetical protein